MDEKIPARTLSESRIYALLAHQRRRLLLRILQDFPTPISTPELAEILADCEREDATDRDRQRALLALHHNHLPRLNDAEVIDFDRDSGAIRRGPNFGVLVGMIADEGDKDAQLAD